MTMPIQFDTLEYAKTLQAAGIPQDQAEAHAQALVAALSGTVVVPGEMVLMKADLLARMDLLRHELEARMDLFKQELLAQMDLMKHELEARMDTIKLALEARMDAMKRSLEGRLRWTLWLLLTTNLAILAAVATLLFRH